MRLDAAVRRVDFRAAGSGAFAVNCDAPAAEEGVTFFHIYRDGVQIAAVNVLPSNSDGYTPGDAGTGTAG